MGKSKLFMKCPLNSQKIKIINKKKEKKLKSNLNIFNILMSVQKKTKYTLRLIKNLKSVKNQTKKTRRQCNGQSMLFCVLFYYVFKEEQHNIFLEDNTKIVIISTHPKDVLTKNWQGKYSILEKICS